MFVQPQNILFITDLTICSNNSMPWSTPLTNIDIFLCRIWLYLLST